MIGDAVFQPLVTDDIGRMSATASPQSPCESMIRSKELAE